MTPSRASTPNQITDWIRNTILPCPERLLIRIKHIEQDRRWREITAADVRYVLGSGQATQVRSSDQTVFWQGKDSRGRLLELMCSMVATHGQDTLIVRDARSLRVGTAYDPKVDDEQIRKQWLTNHPDYEWDTATQKVIRKLQRH